MDGRKESERDGKESNVAWSYNRQKVVENHSRPRPEGIRPVKETLLVIIPCLNDFIFQLF